MTSRRQFLGQAAAAMAAAKLSAAPLGLPVGCQLFPVREQLGRNFDGTLRELAGMGYQAIELCSPPSFVEMGFAFMAGMKAAEIRQRVGKAGLRIASCHYQYQELLEHLDERIAFARELGLKHMVVATLAIPKSAPLDEWKKAADKLNGMGERTRKAGIQLGFHNHTMEFAKIGGVLVFDELMSRFDPRLVKSQFQLNVFSLGFDPVVYLKKYPGRFLSLHLQDWSAAEKREVPVGKGSLDWKNLFTAAKGIEYYFVEMDMEAIKASAPFLRGLKV